MTGSEALLDRARAGFAACAARHGTVERWLDVGGRPVCVRSAGDRVAQALRRPLQHLEQPAVAGSASLVVHAWAADGADALPLPAPAEGEGPVRYADFTDRHSVMAWPDERHLQACEAGGDAWWWVPDIEQAPMFELAMPFRPILHWWSSAEDLQMVHAAAVGTTEHGAVLLAGVSGSGKSTTSLWALTSPTLRFLGDDYVLVDRDRLEVFSLYATAKVHEPDQPRVPHIRAQVLGRREEDKLVAFLDEGYADRLVAHLPARAVLLPRLSAEGPLISPVDAGQALRRLGPSTVLQFPGPAPTGALAALAALVRALPCFDFALGPDPAATPAAVERFLAGAAS